MPEITPNQYIVQTLTPAAYMFQKRENPALKVWYFGWDTHKAERSFYPVTEVEPSETDPNHYWWVKTEGRAAIPVRTDELKFYVLEDSDAR